MRARLGVSKPTLNRMVRAGKLATYADPRNGRVRLVKAADVERLTQPMPIALEELDQLPQGVMD